ncbi:MAG: hypothetical protein LZF61_03340 [Nitrosomonas sp.]|nr:MAG: hypothetical protein LZF61_03340 [Nitrosomonas sp.]
MIVIIGGVLLGMFGWGMHEVGKRDAIEQQERLDLFDDASGTGDDKASYVFDPGVCRQTKKQKLCGEIGDLMQQLQINSTASENLAEQVKVLTSENDRLKEKLVFLQHLVSGNTKTGVSVHQFTLKEMQTPGHYRYALTLLQGGEKDGNFTGNLRFQVKLLQGKLSKIIPLTTKYAKRDFSVSFKAFHRMEESFKVPPDTVVEQIQVQIFKSGGTKAIVMEIAHPSS